MNASSSDEVPSYSMYKYARARKRWAVVYTSLILLSRLFVFGDGELAGRNGLIINLLLGDVCTAFLQFVFFFFLCVRKLCLYQGLPYAPGYFPEVRSTVCARPLGESIITSCL